jgi:hypothetical protein
MGFLGELRCERFNSTGKPYRFMPPFLAQVLNLTIVYSLSVKAEEMIWLKFG